MDTHVLLNLKRRCEIKQRVPSASYSKEFREQAINQVTEEGLSPKEAARRLSMSVSTLEYWLKAAQIGKLGDVGKTQRPLTEIELELAKIKRELAEIKKKRTILLFPPAQAVLKVLVEDALTRDAMGLEVWLNRHEACVDRARLLLSPKTQACKNNVNAWYVPSAWNTKWSNLTRRAEIRHRPPYQTRHTYACWNLTARGNLAFIANQMGHSDYSMLVKVYGRWIDSESPRELGRIWQGMKKLVQITPNLPQ